MPYCLFYRSIIRELVSYIIFIVIIYIISIGNRDPNSFMFKQSLERNFIFKNGFDQVYVSIVDC